MTKNKNNGKFPCRFPSNARKITIPPLFKDEKTVIPQRSSLLLRRPPVNIFEKLSSLYVEHLRKGDLIDEPYLIGSHFLEQLVKRDNLSYMTLSISPSDVFLDVNIPHERQFSLAVDINQDKDFLDAIDNGEIPLLIAAICVKNNWKLFYDYHMILQVQKFANKKQTKEVFSIFYLLKPSPQVSWDFFRKYPNVSADSFSLSVQAEQVGLSERENILQYTDDDSDIVIESKRLCLTYSHLYLGLKPDIWKIEYFLTYYENPFLCVDINSRNIERQTLSKQLRPNEIESIKEIDSHYCFVTRSMDEWAKKISEEDNAERTFDDFEGFESLSDNRRKLLATLEERHITTDLGLLKDTSLPLEIFDFEHLVRIDKKEYVIKKEKLSIYLINGSLYGSVKFDYDSVEREDNKFYIGKKELLDKYILAYASAISSKFYDYMTIYYTSPYNKSKEKIIYYNEGQQMLTNAKFEQQEEENEQQMQKMKALFEAKPGHEFEEAVKAFVDDTDEVEEISMDTQEQEDFSLKPGYEELFEQGIHLSESQGTDTFKGSETHFTSHPSDVSDFITGSFQMPTLTEELPEEICTLPTDTRKQTETDGSFLSDFSQFVAGPSQRPTPAEKELKEKQTAQASQTKKRSKTSRRNPMSEFIERGLTPRLEDLSLESGRPPSLTGITEKTEKRKIPFDSTEGAPWLKRSEETKRCAVEKTSDPDDIPVYKLTTKDLWSFGSFRYGV